MLLSIVVPVYNVEKYLDECIQSILSQIEVLKDKCEILLINDGSTDDSGKICDMYKNNYPDIIKVFHNENQGLLLTRRYGYKNACGEYIINCDSDDTLERGYFEDIINVIIKYNHPDAIIFNFNYYMDNGNKRIAYTDIFSDKDDCMIEKHQVLREFLKRHSVVSLCSKVYRRDCIELQKKYEQFSKVSNGEDTLQSIELFNNAQNYVYLNKALYNYRIGSGMTRKYDPDYYLGFKKVFNEIWCQKDVWKLQYFDQLFSIKVLQTAGRAITQSRYNNWGSLNSHIEYLKSIREDKILDDSINYIKINKNNLQKSHYIFLRLLKYKCYKIICMLLRIKNLLDERKIYKIKC